MNDVEKEPGTLLTEEVVDTTGQTKVISLSSPRCLQRWLDMISQTQKTHYLFELEMWLRSFESYFILKNHPFTEQENSNIVNKNFTEELKIARNVILRMNWLANELVSENNLALELNTYYKDLFEQLNWIEQDVETSLFQPTPSESLALLTETLTDICIIIDNLIKTDDFTRIVNVNLQTFITIGKLTLREFKRSYYTNLLVTYRYKIYDSIENSALVAIINNINDDLIRQEITKTLLNFFRLLKYLDFISSDLGQDRPLKNCLAIFILIKTEAYQLIQYTEKQVLTIPNLLSEVSNAIDGSLYALQMDLKKVFGRELTGLTSLSHASSIYAKVENSHGLLRDCFQQSVVSLVQIFKSDFNGLEIFSSFQTRLDQSLRLRLDIWRLLCAFRRFQTTPAKNKISEVNEQITLFRESSLKYLMYKDWDDFEKMTYQAMSTRVLEDFTKTIHIFATFLEALLGQINMRAVLANHPFDYPEV
ncbi:MAG: hypothetical protein WAQ98_33320 [Blastocatellia bacterium]